MKKYPVDEDIFLKQQLDFSPESERYLDEKWLQPPVKEYPFAKGEVAYQNGIPIVSCNGKIINYFPRACGATSITGAPVERQLRELAGTKTFMVDTVISSPLDHNPNQAFKLYKQRVENILKSVPDAVFLVRIWMRAVGEDYVEKYPGALLTGPNGETDWGYARAAYPDCYQAKQHSRANFLNEWRRYMGEHLYKFLHELGKSKHAAKTFGVYIGAMNTGEWWYYKGKGDPGWDYSLSRQKAFKHYLNMKYGDNISTLPEFYKEQFSANFFDLPSIADRNKSDIKPCSRVSDYNQVLNIPVTNAAIYFAKIIKNASNGKLLAGMEIHSHLNILKVNGTVFLTHLLDNPDIDILGGPMPYNERNISNSAYSRCPEESLRQHNKIWFNEGDYRTHTCYGTGNGSLGEPPISPQGSIEMFKREFARGILKGYRNYLMDFGWNWFYDPEVLKTIGNIEQLYRFMLKTGVTRNAEIAVISDQESQLYGNYFGNPTMMRKYVLDKIGLDYDFYELRDFLNPKIYDKYKFIIFLNIKALADGERSKIDKLKAKNRVVLWMHDPGTINLTWMNSNPTTDIKKLTGINVINQKGHGKVNLTNQAQKLLGFNNNTTETFRGKQNDIYKTVLWRQVSVSDCANGHWVGNVIAPYSINDKNAITLGKDKNDNTFFAIKKFKNWTSVYTATCLLNPEIIRSLAKMAGCHIYTDANEICFTSEKYVAIHATTTGKKVINLPIKTDVYDLFKRSVIARNVNSFEINMKWGETLFAYIGDCKIPEKELTEIEKDFIKDKKQFVKKFPSPSVTFSQYRWNSLLPINEYRKLRRRKPLKNFEGPYSCEKLCVNKFLFSGPYLSSEQAQQTLKSIIEKNSFKIANIEPWTFKDNPERRKSDRFLKLSSKTQSHNPENGLLPWKDGAITSPWIYGDDLGISTNQTVLIAFYLEGEEGQSIELAFPHKGELNIWMNGKAFEGKKGIVGQVVRLPKKRNLFVLALTNSGDGAGFSSKVLEPVTGLDNGKQAKEPAKGVTIWLDVD